MALIAMAVYSTKENGKDKYLDQTLDSLVKTVDFNKHRLILSINGETKSTRDIIKSYSGIISFIINNERNIGTAEAINNAWKSRAPGENAIKMDDDVVIHQSGWIDLMEEAIRFDPNIGIIGLKRKDCWENPNHPDKFYKSELVFLPHKPGEKWIVVEKVNHVMGTCQMYSDRLLKAIGFLIQPKLYGFDDSFASFRSKLAGFSNVFLPQIEIDHIDPGNTEYQKWKEEHAGRCWPEYNKMLKEFEEGIRPLYYNPFESRRHINGNESEPSRI